MFIIKKKDNKRILVNRGANKAPKLVKVEKIKDEFGNVEKIYHYDVYIRIDKRHAIEKNLQTIEIEKSNTPFHKLNVREKIFDNINTSDPKSINLVASNALKIKLDQTLNKKTIQNTRKISNVASDNIFNNQNIGKLKSQLLQNKSEDEIFGTVKRLSLFTKNQNSSKKNLLLLPRAKRNKRKIDKSEKFQFKAEKLLNAGIDPAARLSKIIKNNTSQGFLNKTKGRFTRLTKQNKNPGVFSFLSETLKNSRLGEEDTADNSNFSLQLVEKSGRIGTITQRVTISESQLIQNASNEIDLIFTVRDINGVAIESIPGKIRHKKEKESLSFPKFDFEIEANKTASGQVTLKIINNEMFSRSFNVYSRQLNEYLPQDQINYELKIGNVRVPSKSQVTLFRKGYHFKSNRPVFFRVNAIHDQKEYANSKFASIETGRRLSAINYAGLSAIIQNERIAIQVKNIASSIKKLELYRRDLTKKERNFKITKSYNARLGRKLLPNRGKIITRNSFSNVYTFYDDDVEPEHTYEYKALLYDDNGNKSFSSNSAIENYSKPHGIVELTVERTASRVRGNQKRITLEGNVKRKINDADKLFQDLFGRYYDLFEDDLKRIKDLNALTINLLIETINRDTSEIIRVADVSANSDGNFQTRFTIEANNNFAIKITPRVMPPADVLSKIDNNLPNLAARNRFAPVSAFNTAAIKSRIKQSSARFVSAMGDKHSQRSSRLKGKIFDNKTQLNKTNFDAYYDGNTGDVRYLLEAAVQEKNYDRITISLTRKNVKYLNLDNMNNVNVNLKKINLKKEYYLSRFSVKDSLSVVDYFVMSYEENGNTVIQGLAFNLPKLSQSEVFVNYLFQTPALYGKINFYAQPILKNGKMQSPILIKTIYKDDEGIK